VAVVYAYTAFASASTGAYAKDSSAGDSSTGAVTAVHIGAVIGAPKR